MSDDPNQAPPRLTLADTPDSLIPNSEGNPDLAGTVSVFGVDQAQVALARINQLRAQVGVSAATMNTSLKAAAAAHVNYYLQNAPISGSIHEEVNGKPGFSGLDFFARAAAYGYSNSQSTNENIATLADPVQGVNWFIATINHRIPLLDPAYTDIGIAYGSRNDGSYPITVIDFGMPVWKSTFTPNFFIWPPENGTNFNRTYSGEGPDLFRNAGLKPAYPIGCPITITYRGPGKITYDPNGMSLTDTLGNPVNCYKLADLNSFWTARNSAAIATVSPLAANTTFKVTFTYKIDNGAAQTRTWQFTTGSSLTGDGNTTTTTTLVTPKAGLNNADTAVRLLWQGVDGPVAAGSVRRSWLYGPDIFDARYEPYQESPNGQRVVYYFDKARLEINNPEGDRSSQWFVTGGLLVREMVSGSIQKGNSSYQPKDPAKIPVAGDPAPNNPNAPTYATFNKIASLNNDRRAAQRTGQNLLESLSGEGVITSLTTAPSPLSYAYYDNTLGHNVPNVFWRYMANLQKGWIFVLGLPISEAYWVNVKLAGQERPVLVQLFERRSLTFTPSNPADWQVEMGNIGRHYFNWRYGS